MSKILARFGWALSSYFRNSSLTGGHADHVAVIAGWTEFVMLALEAGDFLDYRHFYRSIALYKLSLLKTS